MIRPETMQNLKVKVKDKVTSTPPATWGRVGAGVLVGGVAIGWLVFPFLLDKVVASQINLSHGKDSRKLWIQLPTLDCYFYLFNVTNPAQVMRGAKPKVQEIGPYCYKEVKDKIDFLEDPSTDTISYSARSTWYENQRDPKCPTPHLTGEEMLVVPNLPLLAILLIGEKDFPPALMAVVNQALPSIFGRVSDVFMRVSARRLLFDGIYINCSARALYPRAVCIALKQNSRALKKLGNNQYEFSFFGAKNHTPEEFRYTVKRGTEDVQEIGRLVAVDGKPELPFWRGDCNKIQGTDSTVFPPFRQKENGSLIAYSSEVCRIIVGVYEGEYDYKGVTGYAFSASFGGTDSNPGDRCFCPADDRCRKGGVLDSLKCQGAPIVASHPHFYLGNPSYVNGVEGLNPSKEKHGSLIVLEPISGSPLVVRKRLQFNIDLKPISYVPVTQRLRRTLVPLIWAEESLDLDNNLMGVLESSLFLPIRAVDVIKWLCIVSGVGLGVTAVAVKYRKYKRDKVHVLNNEEAGQDVNIDIAPKQTVKLEDFNTNQNIDPFFVQDKESKEHVFENGLSAANVLKNISTMSSANGVKVLNVDKATSPTNLNDRNAAVFSHKAQQRVENNSIYLISKGNHDHSSMTGLEAFRSFPHEPSNMNVQNENKDISRKDDLAIDPQLTPQPETSPTKSLELQLSSKEFLETQNDQNVSSETPFTADSSNPKTSALESVSTNHDWKGSFQEPLGNHEVDIFKNNHYPEDPKKEEVLEENTNDLNLNLGFVTDEDSVNLRETNPFGDSVSLPSSEGRKSTSKIDDQKTVTDFHTITENVISNEHSKGASQPTDQEIKAVEEDISKLIAEIAELIPKKS